MDLERTVMKLNKWLQRLTHLVDSDLRAQHERRSETEKALRKLKKHSRSLRRELDRKVISPERRTTLEQDLAIVKLQREKGITLLKGMKKGTEQKD